MVVSEVSDYRQACYRIECGFFHKRLSEAEDHAAHQLRMRCARVHEATAVVDSAEPGDAYDAGLRVNAHLREDCAEGIEGKLCGLVAWGGVRVGRFSPTS